MYIQSRLHCKYPLFSLTTKIPRGQVHMKHCAVPSTSCDICTLVCKDWRCYIPRLRRRLTRKILFVLRVKVTRNVAQYDLYTCKVWVYISQLIRFARASSYVADFNTRNKLLTQKFLKQGYRYHKLRKPFSNFIDNTMIWFLNSKLDLNLSCAKDSEPYCYGDLVYKLKKIVGSNNFSAQFIKIISHYKKIGYNINVLQQTGCLVVNSITVGNFAFLFNCAQVGWTSDPILVPT